MSSEQKKSSKPRRRKRGKKQKKQETKRGPPRRQRRRGGGGFNAERLGRSVGSLFGPAGGNLGAEAGRLFRKITGFGDYKVQSNTLMTESDRLPMFKPATAGTRVVHREYLSDVITSPTAGLFDIQQYPIQPALLATFPWLSNSAENYQEYTINGMVFEFKSNSYDALASTNTASGTVIMSTNYNPLDPPFANKFTMEQSQFTCSDKPSRDLLHPIECSKVDTPANVLYIRTGSAVNGDLRLYDWGNFYIATVGMQGTSVNVGELWVTYDITLLKPKLGPTTDVADHYTLPVGHIAPGGTAYFGSMNHRPTLSSSSDMGTTLLSSDDFGFDTISWDSSYSGKVMVLYTVPVTSTASASLAAPIAVNYTGGAGQLNLLNNVGSDETTYDGIFVYNANGGTTLTVFVTISNGGTIQFTGGTTSTGPGSGDLVIVALPATLTN